ncbi:MAG: tRNA (adenosine(37)-N6)-threonylcarbamoyltransferase complex dimerization subunit type 1 TsaB [Gemmatimonadales bacterium]
MKLHLAIDTATDRGTVALGEPGRVVAQADLPAGRHAAEVTAAVERVLEQASASSPDLAGVVVGDGPGSFTGLRIAFATALGLIGAHRELVLHTVPSLMGAAWNGAQSAGRGARGARAILALFDALRGEVFAALYRFEPDGVQTLLDPTLTKVESLAELLPVVPDVAAGDGAVLYRRQLERWIGRAVVPLSEAGPSAGALVELMAVEGAVTMVTDPASVEPLYGRKAAAQVKWESLHGRPLPDPSGD